MTTLEYERVYWVAPAEVEFHLRLSPFNLMNCTFDHMWDVAAQGGYDMVPGQFYRQGDDPVLYSWPVLRRNYCGRCFRLFDPDDPAPNGVARFEGGRFCRGCTAWCRSRTGRHSCMVCLSEGRVARP